MICAAISGFSFWYGPHLLNVAAQKTSEEKILSIGQSINEIRRLSKEKTPNGLIILNNNGTIGALVNSVETSAALSPKKEAYILLLLNKYPLEVTQSHNFAASITDNGAGDITLVFDEDFPSDRYFVNITGNKTPEYEIIEKINQS